MLPAPPTRLAAPLGPLQQGRLDSLSLTAGAALRPPHLAGLILTALWVPVEAHVRAGWVFAVAMRSVVRAGLRDLGAISRPVAALLLIGQVQRGVQRASQEGIPFMGLRRARGTGLRPGSRQLPGPGRQGADVPSALWGLRLHCSEADPNGARARLLP